MRDAAQAELKPKLEKARARAAEKRVREQAARPIGTLTANAPLLHPLDERPNALATAPPLIILSSQDLRARGIRFSVQWLRKLIAKGLFPRPIRIGEASVGWLAHEVDAWIVARINQRDEETAA